METVNFNSQGIIEDKSFLDNPFLRDSNNESSFEDKLLESQINDISLFLKQKSSRVKSLCNNQHPDDPIKFSNISPYPSNSQTSVVSSTNKSTVDSIVSDFDENNIDQNMAPKDMLNDATNTSCQFNDRTIHSANLQQFNCSSRMDNAGLSNERTQTASANGNFDCSVEAGDLTKQTPSSSIKTDSSSKLCSNISKVSNVIHQPTDVT